MFSTGNMSLTRRIKGLWVIGTPFFAMATETLPSVFNKHYLPCSLLLLLFTNVLYCQQFIVPFKTPADCGVEEFYDISSMSCVRCGSNQLRSITGLLPSYMLLILVQQQRYCTGFRCHISSLNRLKRVETA